MKSIVCPKCENLMNCLSEPIYTCLNCLYQISENEYKNMLKISNESKIEEVEPKFSYNYIDKKFDPIKTLESIKNLLNSNRMTDEEKEYLKTTTMFFINDFNCTICNYCKDKWYGYGGIHYECSILNENIMNIAYYDNSKSFVLKNCPVKSFKL